MKIKILMAGLWGLLLLQVPLGAQNDQNRLSLYNETYWHFVSASADKRVRAQVSLKYRALDFKDDGFYIAYTTRMLWDIWNSGRSWPIDDTNYKPELFWRHQTGDEAWLKKTLRLQSVDFGLRHESNGAANGPDPLDPGDWETKSYFNAFVGGRHAWSAEKTRLRLAWEARSFGYVFENPDIADYLGRAAVEMELDFRFLKLKDGSYLFDENTLSFRTNSSFLHKLASRNPVLPARRAFTYEAGFAFGLKPLMRMAGLRGSLYLFVQYFNGWGEYLSTYNDFREDRVYLGLALRPSSLWR